MDNILFYAEWRNKVVIFFGLQLKVLAIYLCQVGNDIGFTFESRRNFASEDSSNSTHMAQPAMRIAFLGVSSLDVKVEYFTIYFMFI